MGHYVVITYLCDLYTMGEKVNVPRLQKMMKNDFDHFCLVINHINNSTSILYRSNNNTGTPVLTGEPLYQQTV